MLKELVDKGNKLSSRGDLYPIGYGVYKSDPIKYVIHIYPEKKPTQIEIEEYSGENRARAKLATRTGMTIFPYPFADEMGYVFGLSVKENGTKDKNAVKKNKAFISLFDELLSSGYFTNDLLVEAIQSIKTVIADGIAFDALSKKQTFNKTWVTFVYEKGYLKDKQLHEIEETKKYWSEKVKEKVCSGAIEQCCICGQVENTVKNLPLKVTFKGSDRQISSLNKNAFVSYRYQNKDASLGICLACADRASQSLNYLISHNSSNIYIDKSASGKINQDSIRNQTVVYWLEDEKEILIDGKEYSLVNLASIPIDLSPTIEIETTEELINRFLKSPWTGQVNTLNIDENTFYLSILSPNGPGRIAVRDWIQVVSNNLKLNLVQYFEALNLVDAFGRQRKPYVIQELLEIIPDMDPNMVRSIIRSAYLGEKPPLSLFQSAIRRLRVSGARDGSLEEKKSKNKSIQPIEVWQRLCTIIKFYMTFGKEEAKSMEKLNVYRNDAAYQSGRLLAVLERIQRRAATSKLSSTLVDRYYGSASTTPLTVFPSLINMATKAHMPKIRKYNKGYGELENILEEIVGKIDDAGGFPRTLMLIQQGEFALGFYHQRAKFNEDLINKLRR